MKPLREPHAQGHEDRVMRVTVAICTWNRCTSLQRTLQSLVQTERPADLAWEVVVVNNNSSDRTDAVIDSFSAQLPIVKVFEPTPGLSNARNAAVHRASGEYILWTDDDVIVHPGWIKAYVDAFGTWPDAALFGGPIHPVFEGPMPDWLAKGWRSVGIAFCAYDLGRNPVPLSCAPGMVPFGANFAIRKREQARWPYDPALGVSPKGRFMSEETTVMRQLLESGCTGWWVPQAIVAHCNTSERMNLKYLEKYYESWGRTQWIQNAHEVEKALLGRPLWLWRRLISQESRYWLSRMASDPAHWLSRLSTRSTAWGMFKECGLQSSRNKDRVPAMSQSARED